MQKVFTYLAESE